MVLSDMWHILWCENLLLTILVKYIILAWPGYKHSNFTFYINSFDVKKGLVYSIYMHRKKKRVIKGRLLAVLILVAYKIIIALTSLYIAYILLYFSRRLSSDLIVSAASFRVENVVGEKYQAKSFALKVILAQVSNFLWFYASLFIGHITGAGLLYIERYLLGVHEYSFQDQQIRTSLGLHCSGSSVPISCKFITVLFLYNFVCVNSHLILQPDL